MGLIKTLLHMYLLLQRNSISIVANCTKAVNEDNFPIFADAIPVLTQRLQHQVRMHASEVTFPTKLVLQYVFGLFMDILG